MLTWRLAGALALALIAPAAAAAQTPAAVPLGAPSSSPACAGVALSSTSATPIMTGRKAIRAG